MSGLIATISGSTVRMMADSAAYDPRTGVLGGFIQKIRTLPKSRGAFAIRGDIKHVIAFQKACHETEYSDFDEFCSNVPEVMERFSLNRQGLGDLAYDLVIAGYRMSEGAPLLLFSPGHNHMAGFAAHSIYSTRTYSMGFEDEIGDVDGFDVDRGISIFKRMRALPMLDERGGRGCLVGGSLTYAEVTAEGRRSDVVYEWPDKVGQRMDAAAQGGSPRLMAA